MRTALIYFFVCPFIGFINAIINYRSSWAKHTVIAFVAFFGFSMLKSDAVDSARYIDNLEQMHKSKLTLDNITESFYSNEDGQVDIYVPIMTFIFSRFTDDGDLFFLLLGLIYGYFYANNIWLVLNESKGKLNLLQFLALATFSLTIGFWELNGVRMWTAAHVFFNGAFLLLYHDKKKGLFIAAAAAFVHFSFFLPLVLLLIFTRFKLNYRFLYIFYVASFFVVQLDFVFVKSFLESNLPEFLQPRVKSYLGDEYVETITETLNNTNWYIFYLYDFLSYYLSIFVSILFFKADVNILTRKLLAFSMFFLGTANLLSLLPSGSRFLLVGFTFAFATCFITMSQTKTPVVKNAAKILSPLLVLFCIVSIRISLDFFNITTLTNPFIVIFTDISQPLIDFIR